MIHLILLVSYILLDYESAKLLLLKVQSYCLLPTVNYLLIHCWSDKGRAQ